ncbi:MAG: PKD domain-containing protein [Halioglobus sp.]
MPDISLPAAVQGERAIQALGDRLPAVAAAHGMSVAEFARNIRQDSTLWLDQRGRLFYVEVPEPASPANVDVHTQADYPLDQTFLLQSRPGASKTLYLDFNGHVITGTGWNNAAGVDVMYAAPWSADGDKTSFSDSELSDIQAMWRQVAEDYAPFDINVTTQDPGIAALARSGSGDNQYGSRALITPNIAYIDTSYVSSTGKIFECGCGGVAYVGVFASTSQYYQPALVFNGSVIGAGEAITHEVGHNLGLAHDGTSSVGYYTGHGEGETGWAPVMGVGYYQPLVQWSRGEYLDANQGQNDYAVMSSNGLDPAVDEHGDSPAAASTPAFASDGTTATSTDTGTIETPADADVFVIAAGAGPVSISATPVAADPNLDIQIKLRDESGTLLVSANPADQLAANLNTTVDGGTYYITIDGVGKGDPLGTGYTDYGSLGGFKVVATYADVSGLVQPVAAITSDYAPGIAPLAVAFDGSGSQDAASWAWEFGDGNSASGVTANHTYTQSGSFNARLTVTSPDGLTDNTTLNIVVSNQSPTAQGSASATSGDAPLSVDFNDTGSIDADGTVEAYRWDFGDGNSAFTADAAHTYTTAGTYGATLTVTDNLGAEDVLIVAAIEVTQPSIVDSITSADVFSAGTVTGTHTATHVSDSNEQQITERESGGRKNTRYSFAQHSWQIGVPGGTSTISVNGYSGVSADSETFSLSYDINGQSRTIGTLTGSSNLLTSASFDHGPGTLTVTLVDTNRSDSNLSLDTAYINQIFVRTRSEEGLLGSVPSAPTNLQANLNGANEVDLSWTDTADDEFGFRLERRANVGSSWQTAADLPVDSTSDSDRSVMPDTSYDYQVIAFNGAGDSAPSNMASVTTEPPSEVMLEVTNTYKRKGVNYVDLGWSDISGTYSVKRNGAEIGVSSNGTFVDDTLGKGGMDLTYQVCGESACSNTINWSF